MSQEAKSSPVKDKSSPVKDKSSPGKDKSQGEGEDEDILPEVVEEEPWLTAVSPDDYKNEDTCKTFIFRKEGHTFGNALRYVISNYTDVKFCAYTLPHPAEKVMHLRIQTVPGILPQDVLARGLNDLHEIAKVIHDKFTEEMEKAPPPEDVEEPDLPIPKYGVLDEEEVPPSARSRDSFTHEEETFTPAVSPTKQATFSSTMRSAALSGQPSGAQGSPTGPSIAGPSTAGPSTASPPKPGQVVKTPEEIAQLARQEETAHRDALREEVRLKNQKKRRAQDERAAEELEAAVKRVELEKAEKEKADIAKLKVKQEQEDRESSEEEYEADPPPDPESDPESEPELVDLGDSD